MLMLLKKRWYLSLFVIVICLVVYAVLYPKERDLLFLIPEDYSGEFYVAGNIPGEKPLTKEGDWYVVEIGKDGTARTCMDVAKGGSLDFYLVTKSGERKKAPAETLDWKPKPEIKYIQGGWTSGRSDEDPWIFQAFYGTVKDYSHYQLHYPEGLPLVNPNRSDACE